MWAKIPKIIKMEHSTKYLQKYVMILFRISFLTTIPKKNKNDVAKDWMYFDYDIIINMQQDGILKINCKSQYTVSIITFFILSKLPVKKFQIGKHPYKTETCLTVNLPYTVIPEGHLRVGGEAVEEQKFFLQWVLVH